MKHSIATLASWIALASPAFPQVRVDFESDVLPILEKRCVNCHRAPYEDSTGRPKKPKAGLQLDSRGWMLRGGESGPVLVPGDPEQSLMYQLVTLPEDDPDIMPAKGKPLTEEQTETLRRWIEEGAEFGDWTGRPGPDGAAPKTQAPETTIPVRYLVWKRLGEGLRPVRASVLAKLRDLAQVQPVLPESPLLRVTFYSLEAETDDDRLDELKAIADHVAVLELARTLITDEVALTLVKMKRLTHLDLRETDFGDAGLRKIDNLTELRSLNLYGTNVSDRGLRALEGLEKLRDVYLFGTDVTEDGVKRLREHLPRADIRFELDLPEAGSEPASRRRRR